MAEPSLNGRQASRPIGYRAARPWGVMRLVASGTLVALIRANARYKGRPGFGQPRGHNSARHVLAFPADRFTVADWPKRYRWGTIVVKVLLGDQGLSLSRGGAGQTSGSHDPRCVLAD